MNRVAVFFVSFFFFPPFFFSSVRVFGARLPSYSPFVSLIPSNQVKRHRDVSAIVTCALCSPSGAARGDVLGFLGALYSSSSTFHNSQHTAARFVWPHV